ncbi:MAG: transposase [Terracidiphilus sp.]|jgi:hypothetical protein
MSLVQRHDLRNEQAPALLARLRTAVLGAQKNTLPKSAAGKAASYTLTLWNKLTLFLKHPELELSNNLAENSMRSSPSDARTGSTSAAPMHALRSPPSSLSSRAAADSGSRSANIWPMFCPGSPMAPSDRSQVSHPPHTKPLALSHRHHPASTVWLVPVL